MDVGKEPAAAVLSIEGREVRVTHPDKLYFSRQTKLSKLDLVRYYLSVAPGALAGIRDRPIVLKRFVNGAEGEAFYQKRAPAERPHGCERSRCHSLPAEPRKRSWSMMRRGSPGSSTWAASSCIRIRYAPAISTTRTNCGSISIRAPASVGRMCARVALEVKALLEEVGLRGWPKTSGSRGMHVNVRIEPRWTFSEVRRAALALSRAVERRVPALASSKWWKEERHGVFLDYNQNAKDRTTCSAYSVRPLPDARVSTPLHWHEVPTASRPTLPSSPSRNVSRRLGDPHAGMDARAGSLEKLLELAAKDEAAGLGDAPWPPHFRKMEGEAPRGRALRAPRSAAEESAAKRATTRCRWWWWRTLLTRSRAGGSGKMEEQTSPRSPDFSPWTTYWSTPCEAGHPPGPASA